ncbi:MAG TPA: hypothetical protein VKS82_17670 [Streptosporangiaceae bacterium]|nr:hypothetical protein [Streptosporangiaceae bacterium]
MRIRTFVTRAALVAVVAAAPAGAAGAVQAAGSHGPAAECATVKVTAKPGLNTAMIPETIKSTVTNCSSATETVKLTQTISGPFAPDTFGTKSWTLTLTAGQTVTKTRSKPYACCGSYNVVDKVLDSSGAVLATSKASFTFA